VVGAGRNGSVAALTLAMLGVRGLTLIDSDLEDLHNLDASLGGTPAGVGRPKVQNRAEFLMTIRSADLEVEAIPRSVLHPQTVMALRGVDLVITCVDRDAARLAVARAARGWGKVHLDVGTGIFGAGGVRQMGADVRLLLPGEACVCCLGGLRDPAEAEWEAAAPLGSLRRGRRPEWREQRAGSLLTLNQVAVNLGVQLWLDLLGGGLLRSCWQRLEWTNGVPEVRVGSPARARCALCRPGSPEGLSGAA
jgi:molybdopterin/thiamine biosynthesis adenylyltransferase